MPHPWGGVGLRLPRFGERMPPDPDISLRSLRTTAPGGPHGALVRPAAVVVQPRCPVVRVAQALASVVEPTAIIGV